MNRPEYAWAQIRLSGAEDGRDLGGLARRERSRILIGASKAKLPILRTLFVGNRLRWRMQETFTFLVAQDEPLRSAAIDLRRSIYAGEVGVLRDDGFDPVAIHFVALDAGGTVAATFRLIPPEHRPFDFEEFVDLRALLSPNARPALVGRLCIRLEYRSIGESVPIHVGMSRLIATHLVESRITDLFMYTYAPLVRYYRGLRFRDTGITFAHETWGNVHLMHMPAHVLVSVYGTT